MTEPKTANDALVIVFGYSTNPLPMFAITLVLLATPFSNLAPRQSVLDQTLVSLRTLYHAIAKDALT